MNEAEIRKYAMLMQELGLTGLEVKENVGVVRLERAGAAAPAASAAAAEPVAAQSPAPSAGLLIRSPMVGVFYAAPTEDSEPFIKEGDHVKKGDTLCVIEAMKLMNEITCRAGRRRSPSILRRKTARPSNTVRPCSSYAEG